MGISGFMWVLLFFTGFYEVFGGFYWVLVGFSGFFLGFVVLNWVFTKNLVGFNGFYCVSIGSTRFCEVLVVFQRVLLGLALF